MNASTQKKYGLSFCKKIQFLKFNEKTDGFKVFFEFLEHFMIDTFLIKISQFEKTGPVRKIFFPLENSIIKFQFLN